MLKFVNLGGKLRVSRCCLGTMTWGEQNTEEESHKQLDYALRKGVNFIDTAEMYPVPTKAETTGRTEEYIGRWLAKGGQSLRSKIVLASKAIFLLLVSKVSALVYFLLAGFRILREALDCCESDRSSW
mmetsp:Transcript_21880/g.59910  ORF Transcript_21880/g.59910 Transcript_21880/m.59910 type:complete len:128 (+) Transcript_21880:54-437(+)